MRFEEQEIGENYNDHGDDDVANDDVAEVEDEEEDDINVVIIESIWSRVIARIIMKSFSGLFTS